MTLQKQLQPEALIASLTKVKFYKGCRPRTVRVTQAPTQKAWPLFIASR